MQSNENEESHESENDEDIVQILNKELDRLKEIR